MGGIVVDASTVVVVVVVVDTAVDSFADDVLVDLVDEDSVPVGDAIFA